ncbi:40S ribosomal protein S15a-like [Sturnira hondurensis]|uniref:40S ribosomal protein S15a-like n=1 Tax=Sturnira hondurensis TaxID=192404 RepID=UPI0018799AFA|nr:40S ribosomal protein S15a-like [Sturnira hondurensis]
MVHTNVLPDALKRVHNAPNKGKRQVLIRRCCSIVWCLTNDEAWLQFEIIDDHRAGKIVVNFMGRLTKCHVISPRFDVQLRDLEKWQNNLLPSHQFGFIVLATSAGIMGHEEER